MARLAIRFIILSLSVLTQTACGATIFTREDVVLFSRVQGQLLFKGIPVAKAKVVRRYRYDTVEPVEDSCVTNDDGLFELPLVVKKNDTANPLAQFVVYQQLYVERNGELQQIWSHGKMDKSENSEYGSSFKKIICELTSEPKRKEIGLLNVVYTNCEW